MIAQTPNPTPATRTTTHLQLPTPAAPTGPLVVTRTARLRAWARRVDPYELVTVGGLLLVLAVATIVANWPSAQPAAQQQPIIVFRDRVLVATPTLGLPAAAPAEEPPAAMVEQAAPAPIEPTPAPAAQPAELQVMSAPAPTAAPEPTVEVYWKDPNTFVVNGPTVPTVAPEMIGHVDSQGWVCGSTYGDWRDSDPMYTHAECYPAK